MLESESRNVDRNRNRSGIKEFFAGIGIGIRDLKNAGIGIKICPESCITGPSAVKNPTQQPAVSNLQEHTLGLTDLDYDSMN